MSKTAYLVLSILECKNLLKAAKQIQRIENPEGDLPNSWCIILKEIEIVHPGGKPQISSSSFNEAVKRAVKSAKP